MPGVRDSFVAYSPMAGGLLSGKYTAQQHYEGDDIRRVISRYKPENVTANQPIVDLVMRYAKENNVHRHKFPWHG